MSQSVTHATATSPAPASGFSRAWRKRVLVRAALLVFSLVVTAALLEMALRVLYREEEVAGGYFGLGAFVQDDQVGYYHAPGFQGYAYRRGAFDCPVSISPDGLRQTNVHAQRQYPTRLLILGDSFSFGVGVKEESIFVSLIQNALNPQGIGVINGGQCGYCVEQEVKFGIRLAQTVQPELIILSLYPNNDVIGDYYKDYENVDVRYGQRLLKQRWLPIAPLDFLRARSYCWLMIDEALKRNRIEDGRAAFLNLAKDDPERFIQPTVAALRTLRDYGREKNIRLGIMMIPPFSGQSLFDDPLKRVLQAEGIPVLDLGERRFGRQDYFGRDAHWNEQGHKKAAQYLAPFCLELLNTHNKERDERS
jgi:hypothetical protein